MEAEKETMRIDSDNARDIEVNKGAKYAQVNTASESSLQIIINNYYKDAGARRNNDQIKGRYDKL